MKLIEMTHELKDTHLLNYEQNGCYHSNEVKMEIWPLGNKRLAAVSLFVVRLFSHYIYCIHQL